MKSLKKLFKFLPAFALAFLGGLGAVLNYDQAPKTAYADSSLLISNRSLTNYHFVFNDTSTNGLVWDWVFDYDINFYYDQAQNNYYFVLNVVKKYPDWSFTYNGVTKFTGIEEVYNETLVSPRITLSSNTFNSSLAFNIDTIISNPSYYTFEDIFGYWGWLFGYRINYTFVFDNSSGFSPYIVNLYSPSTTDYNLMGIYWNSRPTGFTPNANSPSLSNSQQIISYNVDYSKSNYDLGYSDGYSSGYSDGFNAGYDSGYSTGYTNGYTAGVESQQTNIDNAFNDGYNSGYSVGYNDGYSVDSTVASIFSGILQVGALPINILLAIFNFEILGINLSAFISAIFTVCLTVIIIRSIKGGGGSD